MLAELDAYVPRDAREREMAERLRAFVAENPACFERLLAIGHVTGSAWIVDASCESVLLMHHRKLDRWLQPGGHADGDPDVRGVAVREAFEETGLHDLTAASPGIFDVDIHAIPARGDEAAHEHFDIRFAFFAEPGAAPVGNHESHGVAWIPLAELDRYGADASVRRLAAKTPELRRRGLHPP